MNNHIEQKFVNDLKSIVWPAQGIEIVKEYKDRLSQRCKGDYEIIIPKVGHRNVDVKAERNMPPNFPVEIMQDWQSQDIGWYHTLMACDEIWYGQYHNDELQDVYRVSLRRLHGLLDDVTSKWSVKRCTRGQGDTIFIAAPLADLQEHGVAEKVYSAASEELEIF